MGTKPSEIDRWGTARPIGCIPIIIINAAGSGFDLRQAGHHPVATDSTHYCRSNQTSLEASIRIMHAEIEMRFVQRINRPVYL
jgi:hypothetical protein